MYAITMMVMQLNGNFNVTLPPTKRKIYSKKRRFLTSKFFGKKIEFILIGE